MGLEAEIWAWRWGGGAKERGKIPLCESIGHQSLRGRCQKGDQQNLHVSIDETTRMICMILVQM